MSLLDEAKDLETRPGGRCNIYRLKEILKPNEVVELDEAMASKVSATALSAALRKRGYPIEVGRHSIVRHRSGDCMCRKGQGDVATQ